ncbi:hypothetical protein DUNSADRAFT_11022 [Dunaliella salina]|uniref:Uncharacterized protein n=1 Tax=Dunaliella salina TaxID=3046 RepID=A0ABQ7GE74_DUNSA|nr:hypothetical protein DUNSADRAFT_11022 [Dunaliella salina]|eukprot:KAF5832910.1 hypothetical protein DUNSADRAFT_11022 [Dunaliella salina]
MGAAFAAGAGLSPCGSFLCFSWPVSADLPASVWRDAVAEGRASQIQAQQQAATWGKINGWLSEVAARQQAQAKVGRYPGVQASPAADTGPHLHPPPSPSLSTAAGVAVACSRSTGAAGMHVPNLAAHPVGLPSCAAALSTPAAAATPAIAPSTSVGWAPLQPPSAQPLQLSRPLSSPLALKSSTSTGTTPLPNAATGSAVRSTLLPFDLPPLGATASGIAARPFAFLDPPPSSKAGMQAVAGILNASSPLNSSHFNSGSAICDRAAHVHHCNGDGADDHHQQQQRQQQQQQPELHDPRASNSSVVMDGSNGSGCHGVSLPKPYQNSAHVPPVHNGGSNNSDKENVLRVYQTTLSAHGCESGKDRWASHRRIAWGSTELQSTAVAGLQGQDHDCARATHTHHGSTGVAAAAALAPPRTPSSSLSASAQRLQSLLAKGRHSRQAAGGVEGGNPCRRSD